MLNDIDRGYAELFGAIWLQAVKDDSKIHNDIPLKTIQNKVLDEANNWEIRYTV
jgi:hypothetical protein